MIDPIIQETEIPAFLAAHDKEVDQDISTDRKVPESNVTEHLSNRWQVSDLHSRYEMKVQLKKYNIRRNAVNHLSHNIWTNGIEMIDLHIESGLNWHLFKNAMSLMSCPRFTSHYWSFNKDHTTIDTYRRQNAEGSMGLSEANQEKMESLKAACIRKTLSVYPKHIEESFIMDAQCSPSYLACMLYQVKEGKEQFLAYSLQQTQSSYLAIQSNLTALVLGQKGCENLLRVLRVNVLIKTSSQCVNSLDNLTLFDDQQLYAVIDAYQVTSGQFEKSIPPLCGKQIANAIQDDSILKQNYEASEKRPRPDKEQKELANIHLFKWWSVKAGILYCQTPRASKIRIYLAILLQDTAFDLIHTIELSSHYSWHGTYLRLRKLSYYPGWCSKVNTRIDGWALVKHKRTPHKEDELRQAQPYPGQVEVKEAKEPDTPNQRHVFKGFNPVDQMPILLGQIVPSAAHQENTPEKAKAEHEPVGGSNENNRPDGPASCHVLEGISPVDRMSIQLEHSDCPSTKKDIALEATTAAPEPAAEQDEFSEHEWFKLMPRRTGLIILMTVLEIRLLLSALLKQLKQHLNQLLTMLKSLTLMKFKVHEDSR